MDKNKQFWMVIPATGSGQRMNADRPKQYLKLSSRTILEHTLDNVLSHPRVSGAVLVLSGEDQYWQKLQYQHEKPIYTCIGGEQRYHSVYNGLVALQQQLDVTPMVLIHDAVRPFVSHSDLDALIAVAENNEAGALLAVPVADTLKFADDKQAIINTQSRENLWRAFTPQAFKLDKIKTALERVIRDDLEITDDASAMEVMGYRPELVASDGVNIKITTQHDLLLAEMIVKSTIM